MVLKRSLHAARYEYDRDEAVVLCQLALLRIFGVSDGLRCVSGIGQPREIIGVGAV